MTTWSRTGTSEDRWLPFLAGRNLPALPLRPLPSRVVVVAPHPDDEVLGVGGLLAMLATAGVPVAVVAVTDGEASHPGGSVPPAALRRVRAAESVTALAALGVHGAITRLGLPDGGAADLQQPVVAALQLPPQAWLLAPWVGEGHPDHEAVGRACAQVAARDGARLLSYPVWMWHWAVPDQAISPQATPDRGTPDPVTPDRVTVPWAQAWQVPLPTAAYLAKSRALAAFASQTAPLGPLPADSPVLPPPVLARFRRPFEVVFG